MSANIGQACSLIMSRTTYGDGKTWWAPILGKHHEACSLIMSRTTYGDGKAWWAPILGKDVPWLCPVRHIWRWKSLRSANIGQACSLIMSRTTYMEMAKKLDERTTYGDGKAWWAPILGKHVLCLCPVRHVWRWKSLVSANIGQACSLIMSRTTYGDGKAWWAPILGMFPDYVPDDMYGNGKAWWVPILDKHVPWLCPVRHTEMEKLDERQYWASMFPDYVPYDIWRWKSLMSANIGQACSLFMSRTTCMEMEKLDERQYWTSMFPDYVPYDIWRWKSLMSANIGQACYPDYVPVRHMEMEKLDERQYWASMYPDYVPYDIYGARGGGGGGHSHIMSHRYVPLWRPPFSVFSSRSHDMRFYLTAPRFASDSLPRYTKNNAHSPLPGTARSLASVILPLRHSLFSLAAS